MSWERPRLIYSLVAPPVLSTERSDLEERELPPKPEILLKQPFTFVLRVNSLKWDVREFEALNGSIAVYDMKEKRKITENFNFSFDTRDRIGAIFSLEEYQDEYVVLIRLEKSLQGDQYDPVEAYQREIPEIKREKIRQYMKSNQTLLQKFKMQFAWTFVSFAGLKHGKGPDSRKQSGDENAETGTFNLLEDRSSSGSMVLEDEEKSDSFVPHNGTLDFRIKQFYKMDPDKLSDEMVCNQVVEVCRNPQKYKQKTVNCDFSISVLSTADAFNIKSDDLRMLKPWKPEVKNTLGRIVREFPKPESIPKLRSKY